MARPLAKALAAAAALAAGPVHAELFVDVGAQRSEVTVAIGGRNATSSSDSGLHLGLGFRRDVGERSSIGVRVEIDDVVSETMLALRAFDYAYHFSERFAATAFAGAARLDVGTVAYGYYAGGGVRLKDVLPRWDLGVELRHGDELARDNLLPGDPEPGRADFYDVTAFTLYLSRRF